MAHFDMAAPANLARQITCSASIIFCLYYFLKYYPF